MSSLFYFKVSQFVSTAKQKRISLFSLRLQNPNETSPALCLFVCFFHKMHYLQPVFIRKKMIPIQNGDVTMKINRDCSYTRTVLSKISHVMFATFWSMCYQKNKNQSNDVNLLCSIASQKTPRHIWTRIREILK